MIVNSQDWAKYKYEQKINNETDDERQELKDWQTFLNLKSQVEMLSEEN